MDWLNPLNWMTPSEYYNLWTYVYYSLFHGFWARFFSVVFLLLAFWFGVRRQNIMFGLFFFGLTVLIVYLGGFLQLIKGQ